MKPSILVVDDEKHTRDGLFAYFDSLYEVFLATNAKDAIHLLEIQHIDLVLTDLRMGSNSGMSVIDKCISFENKKIPCILMTAYGDVETAVMAMKRGAYDFVQKPVNLEKLEILMQRAIDENKLKKENLDLKKRLDEKFSFAKIIGKSPVLMETLNQLKQVAPSKASVLLTGQTGTGKELASGLIHQNSPRANKPFVAVHCAAIAPTLLESELFGHEKGAFTGANERRKGRFETADKGTIFLDEIGEIDASIQIKLLRFLEDKSFERVGSSTKISVDVRIICATNKDLLALCNEGKFRHDLYYRLNVVQIKIPSLSERKEDIDLLLDYYIDYFCKENSMPKIEITKDARKALNEYKWAGNIRELRNFCENIVVMRSSNILTIEDISKKFPYIKEQKQEQSKSVLLTKKNLKEDDEKQNIRKALIEAKFNRTLASEALGISRRTLIRKLAKWPDLDEL